MAGLVPAIHVLQVCPSMEVSLIPLATRMERHVRLHHLAKYVDGRDKPGHDGVPDDGGPTDFMILIVVVASSFEKRGVAALLTMRDYQEAIPTSS
jgi:hypothetical protein